MLYCFLVLLDPHSQKLQQSLLVDVLDPYSMLHVHVCQILYRKLYAVNLQK